MSQDISKIRVELPWPPDELSPNYRTGWRVKHDPKARYRSDCYYIAKSQNVTFSKNVHIPLFITFHTKTARTPDLDNCLSWIKNGLDSVAKAWGVNDRQFRPITIDFGSPVKGGKVVVEA